MQALVVCLHGRGASEPFAFAAIGVHPFVAERRLPWAVVSPDGGAASYWHPRRDGTDAQAMVFDELVPMLREQHGPVPVGLLGWSMGGYGALLAAADRRPDVRAIAAASPALWASFSRSAPGAFDDVQDFTEHDLLARVAALRAMPLRIDCGADDPFIGPSRDLASRLRRRRRTSGPASTTPPRGAVACQHNWPSFDARLRPDPYCDNEQP